jgi:hypothetical protein
MIAVIRNAGCVENAGNNVKIAGTEEYRLSESS